MTSIDPRISQGPVRKTQTTLFQLQYSIKHLGYAGTGRLKRQKWKHQGHTAISPVGSGCHTQGWGTKGRYQDPGAQKTRDLVDQRPWPPGAADSRLWFRGGTRMSGQAVLPVGAQVSKNTQWAHFWEFARCWRSESTNRGGREERPLPRWREAERPASQEGRFLLLSPCGLPPAPPCRQILTPQAKGMQSASPGCTEQGGEPAGVKETELCNQAPFWALTEARPGRRCSPAAWKQEATGFFSRNDYTGCVLRWIHAHFFLYLSSHRPKRWVLLVPSW